MPIGKIAQQPKRSAPRPTSSAGTYLDYSTAFAMSISAGAARGVSSPRSSVGPGAPASDQDARRPSGSTDYMTAFVKTLNAPKTTEAKDESSQGNRLYSRKPVGSADYMTSFASTVKARTGGAATSNRVYDLKPAATKAPTDYMTAFATSVKSQSSAASRVGKIYEQKPVLAKGEGPALDAFTAFATQQQKSVTTFATKAQKSIPKKPLVAKGAVAAPGVPMAAEEASPTGRGAGAGPGASGARNSAAAPATAPAAAAAGPPSPNPTPTTAPAVAVESSTEAPGADLLPEVTAATPAAAPPVADGDWNLSVEERYAKERARVRKGGAGLEFDPSEVADDGGDATLDDLLSAMAADSAPAKA